MPVIRAVLFDFGLVLSGPPDPAAHRRMESILHATRAELEESYWRHRLDYDLGVLNGTTFWRTVATELHHPLTENELAQLLAADVDLWTQPNQPMIDWALSVQRGGAITGILSNMGDAMEAGILERFSWLAGFTHHTFSHRLGLAKPDERIYRHALAALSVPAEGTLFIDDRLENVEAAQAFSIHTIHYTSHEAFLRALESGRFSGLPAPANTAPML